MKICPDCITDKELNGFILSSTEIGNCEVCNKKDTPVKDIEELLDYFQELINNFGKSGDGLSLKSIIQESWKFFSSDDYASKILDHILPLLKTEISNSEVIVNYTNEIIGNYEHWELLKDELRWSRRFFINIENLEDLGWDGFFNTQYELKPKDELFRARLHHQSGLEAYKTNEMYCPEPLKASGGRANPLGIPYLYLSDNAETVLYEVRASYLDELSIGSFYLKDKYSSIKIVDFTEDTALFQPNKVNETIKAKLLRDKISKDLSKPMRRYDSEIDYIPTQFICEFIKVFTGASGIRFSSSLHPNGKNVVIFDQKLMECRDVKLKKVNNVNLTAVKIN